MSKGKVALGALIGSLIGVGLLVLGIYLASSTGIFWLVFLIAVVGWLIAGLTAGLIATSPGRGALAGFITAVFTFIINSIVIVFLTTVTASGFFILLVEILTLRMYDGSSIPTEVVIIFVLIGLLVSFIVSLFSGVFNIVGGLIGGAIRNPNKRQQDAYQEYPTEDYR
ncbi:MAG: hypothetical protein HZR80_15955 [Candidatus Heimdallarchaeota archaeon]